MNAHDRVKSKIPSKSWVSDPISYVKILGRKKVSHKYQRMIRSQATFSSEPNTCSSFSPNRLRPDICTECYHKIFAHSSDAVTDDKQIRAALEYSNKGRKVPSIILEEEGLGHLYLGGFASVLNKSFLSSAAVSGIVNTAKGLEMFGPRWTKGKKRAKDLGIEFLEVNWIDSEDQVLSIQDLKRVVHFIRKHRRKGGGVLVHCAQGKSRSTTAVIAYLLAEKNIHENVFETLEFIKSKRMMAQPNNNFLKILETHNKNGVFQALQDAQENQSSLKETISEEEKEEEKEKEEEEEKEKEKEKEEEQHFSETKSSISDPLAPIESSLPLLLSESSSAALGLLNVVDSVMRECLWTQEKTADQLVEYTKSELLEVTEAIENRRLLTQEKTEDGDDDDGTKAVLPHPSDDLESEVGDLLFDALLLARICERDFSDCTLEGMLRRVSEKIVRRCPHVFAGEVISSSADAAAIWQREKAKEKATTMTV